VAIFTLCMGAVSCLKIPLTTTLELDFEQEVVASNPMKKDEVWTNTRVINLKAEVEKRGISINSLKSARLLGFFATVNNVRCEQLSSASAKVNGLGLKDVDIPLDVNKCATEQSLVASLDITSDLKAGNNVTILYSMTAKEEFTKAHGFTVTVVAEVEYWNKQ
jgi:hypothetical protein